MDRFYYRGYDVTMMLYKGVWYCDGVNYLNGFCFDLRIWSLHSKAGVSQKQVIFDVCSDIDRRLNYGF